MRKADGPGIPALMAGMALFVVLGIPLVGFLWHSLNHLLNGSIAAGRAGASVLVALVLWGVLRLLARMLARWDAPEAG